MRVVNATGFSAEQYHEQGYTGPIRVFSTEEAARLRGRFFDVLGQKEEHAGPTNVPLSAWHHKHRWVYEMVTEPAVLDMISSLIGPNVVMWAVHFWYKQPNNGKYLPWHQDGAYWPMEPKKNVTAWFALGPTLRENGCLRVLPGTHHTELTHEQLNDGASGFGQGLKSEGLDESTAVDLEMKPGEIVIFNEKTVHGSGPNVSDIPRVAFSVRYTTPDVRFLTEQWTNVDRIKTYLVRGEDTHHLNDAITGLVPTA